MPTVPITQSFVDSIQYDSNGPANQLYFDEKIAGLCLQVGRRTKSWCIQHHTRPRKRFADATATTLRAARADAQEYVGKLSKGIDPWGRVVRRTGEIFTLRELTKAQLDSPRKKEKGKRRQATLDATWEHFETFLGDWLDQGYAAITHKAVNDRFALIAAGEILSKRGNKVGTYSRAQGTMSYLRTAFKYAIKVLRYEGGNPVDSVSELIAHGKGTKHRALTNDQLAVLGECFRKWPARANPRIPGFIKLMLYTGFRVRATQELRWEYIHDDRIVQPESQSKSNRVYVTPLTPQIRAELALLRQLSYDEWVFPSDSESGHASTSNWAIGRVKEECGIQTTNHSLRYTFAKIGDELAIQQQVVAMLLDHSSEFSITDRYQIDSFVEKTTPAIEKINHELERRMIG